MNQVIKQWTVLLICVCCLASPRVIGAQKPHETDADETVDTVQEVKEANGASPMPIIWPAHAAIMSFTAVLLIISMFIARNKSKDRFWLPKHQTLGMVSPFLLLIGFGSVFYMLTAVHQEHFDVPHAWLGATVIELTFVVPILGYTMMKKPGSKIPLRKIHVWLGRLTIVGMLGVAASGLFTAGLLTS